MIYGFDAQRQASCSVQCTVTRAEVILVGTCRKVKLTSVTKKNLAILHHYELSGVF